MSVIIRFGPKCEWYYNNRTFDYILREYARLCPDDTSANEFLERVSYTYGWNLSQVDPDTVRKLGIFGRVVGKLSSNPDWPAGDDRERERTRAVVRELAEMVREAAAKPGLLES